MTKKNISLLFLLVLFCPMTCLFAKRPAGEASKREISMKERRADRNFIHQNFDKAMALAEEALSMETNTDNKASMHLKTARLYYMLRNYVAASEHYASALEMHSEMLTMEDICDYIDALRFQGLNREAEAICLNNAYRDPYSRYQRYQNTLQALSMRHSIEDEKGYHAERLELNGEHSEFWINRYEGNTFYAISYSPFNDPGKLFFHRTRYYTLEKNNNKVISAAPSYKKFFRRIPIDLQNGPVTFNNDLSMMISTVIKYNKSKVSVDFIDKDMRPFRTKLVFSTIKEGSRRFSKYTPLFEGAEKNSYSYAQPFLLEDDNTLLFSSDMPGGYGGFDLYITHWDSEKRVWSVPTNLGPSVNTEGNEIFPVVYDKRLIFASNGHPGFGAYDLYGVAFKNHKVSSEVKHMPAPVNSVYNDYYFFPIDANTAYFVSDRNIETKDDIYYLKTDNDFLADDEEEEPFYGMTEEQAVRGGNILMNGGIENVKTENIDTRAYAPAGLLMTLYFDFDSDKLTPASIERLDKFLREMGDYHFENLRFDGFADEFGTDIYNIKLSEKRAKAVADYLTAHNKQVKFEVVAHGRTSLTKEQINREIGHFMQPEVKIDWIWVNRLARKVEIYHVK